jgi:Flp pilus assembly secretin CpaC
MAIGLLIAAVCLPQQAAAQALEVELDRAEIVRLPDRVATLIIGNPAVADGTLQTGGLLVVTGKGYGTTNVIALDAKGEVLAEHTVTVRAPRDGTLTVWRGVGRETWSCAPRCERSVMLGDAADFFDGVVAQTGARNGHASGK